MPRDLKQNSNQLTLAIHSTDNSFGFAFREIKSDLSDKFFIKKFKKLENIFQTLIKMKIILKV